MKRDGCRNGLVFRFGGCGVRAGSEDGKEKIFPQEFGISKKRVTFAVPNPYEGSLAQLVQSVCLTSRGSGVRIPQLPRNETRRLPQPPRFSYYLHTVLRLHTEIPAVNDTPLRKPTRRHSSRHRALRKRFRIGRFRHRAPSAHPLAKEAHRGLRHANAARVR